MEEHLRASTAVLFDQRNFEQTSLLDDLHASLHRALLSHPTLNDEFVECSLSRVPRHSYRYVYAGLNVRAAVAQLKYKLLQAVKLMMLEKKSVSVHAIHAVLTPCCRVIVHGKTTNTRAVCVHVLCLASLMPGLLQYGLSNCAAEIVEEQPDHDDDGEPTAAMTPSRAPRVSDDVHGQAQPEGNAATQATGASLLARADIAPHKPEASVAAEGHPLTHSTARNADVSTIDDDDDDIELV